VQCQYERFEAYATHTAALSGDDEAIGVSALVPLTAAFVFITYTISPRHERTEVRPG
jgi:hypothetical protein